mgnify:CR=1 FL=1
MAIKKLYLSNKDKKIAGLCGGLAQYFDIDSTLVRLLWVIFTFFSMGAGIIVYIVALAVMPEKPNTKS